MTPNSKFSKICVKTILVILFALLGFIFVKSIFKTSVFATHFNDIVQQKALVLIIFSIALMIIIFAIFKLLNRCSKKTLTIITISIFAFIIILQTFISFKFNIHFVTDSYMINDQALSIAKGINKGIDTTNLYYYYISNNNFIVIFLALIYKILLFFGITNYVAILTLFNALLIDLSIFFVYKTLKICFNRTVATKYMILSLLNPINYFIIFWVYSATFSMPLTTAIVYLVASIWKSDNSNPAKNNIKVGLISLIGVVGFFLRPTVLIPIIAAILCFILFVRINKNNLKKIFVSLAIFIMVGILSFLGINKLVYSYVDDTSGYFPVTHYIMLGLSNDGKFSADVVHNTAKYKTKEEKQKYHIKEIKRLVNDLGFLGVSKLYLNKTETTWGDGSAAYPGFTKFVENEDSFYNYLFGEKNDFILIYSQLFRILTLLFSAILVLVQFTKKKSDISILVSITMLGAIVFYMIWESKECYSVPFIPLLLMMECLGIDSSIKILKSKCSISSKVILLPLLCIIEIATLIIGFTYYIDFTQRKYTAKNMAIYSYGSNWQYQLDDASSKNKIIKQSFYTKNDFNTLEFKSFRLASPNIKYDVTLTSDSKTLSKKTIDSSYIKGDQLAFSIKPQHPINLQKYTVTIKPQSNQDGLSFAVDNYTAMPKYSGDLYINNDKQKANLLLRAYFESKNNIMSSFLYIFLIGVFMILELLSMLVLIKRKD